MRNIFAAITFIAFCTVSQAQSLPDNYGFKKMDNGLEVLVIENPSFPLVTIELAVKSGSMYETPKQSGLAFLNQFLFFSANKDFPSADQLKTRMTQLGIVSGENMEEEYSSFYITLSKNNFDNGLKLINGAARSPLYMPDEIATAFNLVNAQYQQAKSDPVYLLDEHLKHLMWKDDFHRKNRLGNYDVIKNAGSEQLQQYHDQFFVPNNCLLIISGNVNRLETFNKVQATFGDWKSGKSPFDQSGFPVFEAPKLSTQFVEESPLAQTPVLLLSFRAPDYSSNRTMSYAANVFSNMLIQQGSSYNESLVASNLALQADVVYDHARYGSTMNFLLLANGAQLSDACNTLQNEMQKWNFSDYFTDKLLAASKKRIEGDYSFSNEKITDLSHNLAKGWATMGLHEYVHFSENIDAVTIDDVLAFVNQFLLAEHHLSGMLIAPADRVGNQTNAFFTDTHLIDEYVFTFEKNETETQGIINTRMMQSFAQFLQNNPTLLLEMTAYQDLNERKGTAMDRFLDVFKKMKAAGVSQMQLDAMKVSLYIQSGDAPDPMKSSQFVSFKILSTTLHD